MYFGYVASEPVFPDTDIVIIDFPLLNQHAITRTEFDTDTLMCELNSDETALMKDFTAYLFHSEDGKQRVQLYDKAGNLIAVNTHPLVSYEETKKLNILFNKYI